MVNNTNKLISWQAALDAIEAAYKYGAVVDLSGLERAYDVIRDLAPVQQLTDLDLLELEHRFGKYVRVVVEEMIEKNMK